MFSEVRGRVLLLQHLRLRGVLWPRPGAACAEGSGLLHSRKDEEQTKQHLCRLPQTQEVRMLLGGGGFGGGGVPEHHRLCGCSGILVCTDVMARGVDIPDVNWVLQYDPPSRAR